ncbi:MAG: YfhO family protein, partial [Candidatus Hydrogenedentes bacterium]|nr:YfhO family protein [Candidatus Hydrogenedentota bacterium]
FARSENRPRGERARVAALAIALMLCVAAAAIARLTRPASEGFAVQWMGERAWLPFPLFALPMLAAIAVDRWVGARRTWRALLWLAPVPVGAAVAATVAHLAHAPGPVQYGVLTAAAFAGLAGLALALHRVWHKPRIAAALCTAVLLADLAVAGHGVHACSPRKHLFFDTDLTRFLAEQPPGTRVSAAPAGIPAGLLPVYGIEQSEGVGEGFCPRPMQEFCERIAGAGHPAQPVCAVQYRLHDPARAPDSPADQPGRFLLTGTFDGVEVYADLDALPRAFLVGRLAIEPDVDSLFARMSAPDYDPKRLAVTSHVPSNVVPEALSVEVGRAVMQTHTATRVDVDVDCAESAVLVLADAYCPGWHARLDGAPAELFPVYHAFRGVIVPAGRHRVQFRYAPRAFTAGRCIAFTTLALSLIASLAALSWDIKRKRRRRPRSIPLYPL